MRDGGIAISFNKIEISCPIGFQARDVFVAIERDERIVIKIFVKIGFTIVVRIVQACDLITPHDIQFG